MKVNCLYFYHAVSLLNSLLLPVEIKLKVAEFDINFDLQQNIPRNLTLHSEGDIEFCNEIILNLTHYI